MKHIFFKKNQLRVMRSKKKISKKNRCELVLAYKTRDSDN
jgi:hypothetical protein